MNKKVVSILSGGLDSCVATASAIKSGYDVVGAIGFQYGQRHDREITCAYRISEALGIKPFVVLHLPRSAFVSALTGQSEVPQDRSFAEMTQLQIAPTYVPNRNMSMISVAAAYAISNGAQGVVGGWHWDDSSGYPRQ
jgi:7-cyano-7-deazaguanine synthase